MKLLKVLTVLFCFAIGGCDSAVDEPVGGPDPAEMGGEMENDHSEMGEDPVQTTDRTGEELDEATPEE
jgi:hypothetical protein